MDFGKVLFFVFACFMVVSMVAGAPEPRWKGWKKIEKIGQHIRDGIIKAGPAVAVVGQTQGIIKGR
ncbi:unnamed protein product [Diatraea saccharalis]|uniref:Uncharacterized protein n=1 Tax=Diatraea saccharalis TaxID=40085 RepID=A0A9N9WJ72_9NEOP|nr:unnamed protein product [Diatraea saccharalis]